ncbi:MAG: hypothetical protein U0354_03720 [Candidatus Sericytochromatia bacterium]
MIDFETYKQILIIIFSPLFIIFMYQLTSFLNRTFLRTAMALIEIEDIEKLTGISHKKIRMINNKNNQTLFKIIDDNNNEVSNIVFEKETIKLLSANNIEIDQEKYFELRKEKFAFIIGTDSKTLDISNNGNTFTKYDILDSGEKILLGSITFDENSEVLNTSGYFNKYK